MKKTIKYYGRDYTITIDEEKQAYVEWLEAGTYWNGAEVRTYTANQGESNERTVAKMATRSGLTDKVKARIEKEVLELIK